MESIWATVPFGRDVAVLARDENGVAALLKPAGVLSHPNERKDEARSLVVARYDPQEECFGWPAGEPTATARLWLLNRLDSATSGVILVAADGELARELRRQFRDKRVTKIYQALVFGRPPQPTDTWRDVLAVTKRAGQIRTSAGMGNVRAETRVKTMRTRLGAGPLSLLQLEPLTGRSHQLRVQCAKRRLPIVGDQTYGDFGGNREFAKRTGVKRMFLHSLETRCRYEWHGREFTFKAHAPLPPEFDAALRS
ncbi:MAG TPA: RNA pseudouridine synthase [Opitutus sp.]|nr:RNA pseudouridine synthase [Opitutus sp.]